MLRGPRNSLAQLGVSSDEPPTDPVWPRNNLTGDTPKFKTVHCSYLAVGSSTNRNTVPWPLSAIWSLARLTDVDRIFLDRQ